MNDAGFKARLLSGIDKKDAPAATSLVPGRYIPVKSFTRRVRFALLFSIRIAMVAVRETLYADLLHISYARELIPMWLALVAIVTRRPMVLQPHGMLTTRTSVTHRFVDALLVRPIARRASVVIALTEREQTALVRWFGRAAPQISVLGNPLPPKINLRQNPRKLEALATHQILFVARLHPRKRVTDFLDAAVIASDRGHNWTWTIVGPDEGDGPKVQAAAARTSNIRYVGAVSASDVVQSVDAATLFVLPSTDEPWGNVLASALALAVPSIVASSAALSPGIQKHNAGAVFADGSPLDLYESVARTLRPEAYEAASRGAISFSRERLDPQKQREALTALLFAAIYGIEASRASTSREFHCPRY